MSFYPAAVLQRTVNINMNQKSNGKIAAFIEKYKEQLSYLFFGVLTTVVNYLSFALLRILMGDGLIHLVNILTFIIATLFAYVTNKLFVFKSKTESIGSLIKELISFFGSRISSYAIEALGLILCVDVLNVGRYHIWFTDGTMIAKIVLSFVAVIINYFFSKLFVFRKNKGDGSK